MMNLVIPLINFRDDRDVDEVVVGGMTISLVLQRVC